jgi:hypothetical protein
VEKSANRFCLEARGGGKGKWRGWGRHREKWSKECMYIRINELKKDQTNEQKVMTRFVDSFTVSGES